jgi:hypothetical protein
MESLKKPTKEATFGLYKKQFEASVEFSKEHNRLCIPWRFEIAKSDANFSLQFYLEYIQPILKYNAWYITQIVDSYFMFVWEVGVPCNGQHTVLFYLFPDSATTKEIENEVNTNGNKITVMDSKIMNAIKEIENELTEEQKNKLG